MQVPREDSDGTGDATVGDALATGAPERVGWFRYCFDDER